MRSPPPSCASCWAGSRPRPSKRAGPPGTRRASGLGSATDRARLAKRVELGLREAEDAREDLARVCPELWRVHGCAVDGAGHLPGQTGHDRRTAGVTLEVAARPQLLV